MNVVFGIAAYLWVGTLLTAICLRLAEDKETGGWGERPITNWIIGAVVSLPITVFYFTRWAFLKIFR